MKWKQMIGIFAVLIVISCLSMNVVSAHRLHVVHKISELEIEAYFAGGSPCRDAEVTVCDNEGNLYMNGVTNEEGKFGFPPKIGIAEYIVVVNATHMPGHRGEATIKLSQNVAEAGGTGAELQLYSRIIAGFGYLIGIAGVAMAYMGWKQKKKYGGGDKEQ